MDFFKLSVLLLVGISLAYSEKVSYKGYRVMSVFPTTTQHVKLLRELELNQDFDVWSSIKGINQPVDVMLSPEALKRYEKILKVNGLRYKTLGVDVQDKIDEEEASMKHSMNKRSAGKKSIVGTFASYTEIVSFVEDIASANPDIASQRTVGQSFEKRQIKELVIKGPSADRGIVIDCGLHAREWIAISSCVWAIDQLIREYRAGDDQAVRMLNKYEIHFFPLMNPDGYEFARSSNRMWRKNRFINPGTTCVGVDLNRNFGFQWRTGGSSNLPCSDVYAGPKADSELETQALENAILEKKNFYDAYLTIHTYGNYWLSSWSYSKLLPDDFSDLLAASNVGAAGITSHVGTKITTGNSAQLFGILSGVSDDWAKGYAGIKYSYTLELAPGDPKDDRDASFGFILPEDRAPRVGEEFYKGVKAFANYLF